MQDTLDPRLFARLTTGLVFATALAWIAIYASFPIAASAQRGLVSTADPERIMR